MFINGTLCLGIARGVGGELLEAVLPRPDDTEKFLGHAPQATAGTPPGKPVDMKKGAGLATGPLLE